MAHQMNPRLTEQHRRFEQIRQALAPQGVSLIVGDGSRGYAGRCLRLRYLHDGRGNPVGYRARLDEITRQDGRTTVRSTASQEVYSEEVWLPDQPNHGGDLGAFCTLVSPERVLQVTGELLHTPVFGEPVTL